MCGKCSEGTCQWQLSAYNFMLQRMAVDVARGPRGKKESLPPNFGNIKAAISPSLLPYL